MTEDSVHDWGRRQDALAALRQDGGIGPGELVREGFRVIDACINELDLEAGGPFERVCAITLCKGRRLAFATYMMMLEGVGQEAGAVARPILECAELLAYFVDDPERIEEAICGDLPPAGNIAQEIGSDFQFIRDHWNTHASHFGYTYGQTRHLVDFEQQQVRLTDPLEPENLRHNVGLLVLFQLLLVKGAIGVFRRAGRTPQDIGNLISRAERFNRLVEETEGVWERKND